MTEFKVGDWITSDMKVQQIKEIYENGGACLSDGHFQISGNSILERCRPLTLRNKAIAESFKIIYARLDKMDGHAGFNYPDINRYFCQLSLDAIDSEPTKEKEFFDKAHEFINEAREHKSVIQGVNLFRRAAWNTSS